MEFHKFLTFSVAVTFLTVASNLPTTAQAYNFFAGGRDGWVLHPSEDYNQWAGRNRFLISDTIYFKYKKGEDSVLLVTAADYSSCNTNNPIQKWDDGESVFQFDRSGPFYFISGSDGHCQQGQKLIVVVLAVRRPPPVPSPMSAPPPEAAVLPPSSLPPAPAASPPAASPPGVAPGVSPASSVPVPSTSTSPSGSETAASPASDIPANASPPAPGTSAAPIAGGRRRIWASVAAGIVVMFIVVRG